MGKGVRVLLHFVAARVVDLRWMSKIRTRISHNIIFIFTREYMKHVTGSYPLK